MGEKILEVEHNPGEELVLRIKPPLLRMLPEEAMGHLRKARKERLLALKSLIDRAIERMEEREKTQGEGRTKIEIK